LFLKEKKCGYATKALKLLLSKYS